MPLASVKGIFENGDLMLDKFDYAEPRCSLCEGRDFYYPDKDAPIGTVPIGRILEKADGLFNKNNYQEAGRHLEYWRDEARNLRDRGGELAIESELIGFYRKQREKEKGLLSAKNALLLTEELGQGDMVSGATVFINCATLYKEFDMAKDALPLYLRAEKVYKELLPESDTRLAGLYNNMAVTLSSLGRTEEAENAYFTALEILGKNEKCELDSAITYVNMAHMYDSIGKTDMIRECMKIAYSLLYGEKTERNGYCAFVLEKCAPSFEYFGDTESAQKLKNEAKEIYERT